MRLRGLPASEGPVEVLKVDSSRPDRRTLDAAAEAVLRGGVIAFPTDTVYGLGCSLLDVAAVEMVGRLKRRARDHAYISLIPDPSQALGLALSVSGIAKRLIDRCWPGPLSLIFVAAEIVPPRVRGAGGTIALRCPNDVLLDGGPRTRGIPSTLVDVSGPRPKLLRRGALDVTPWLGEFEDLTRERG